MNDLPDDLAKPRRDHSLIANIVVASVLIALTIGALAFYYALNGPGVW